MTAANSHLKSESISGQLALKSVIMTKLLGSSWTLDLVLRTKVFVNTIFEHCWQTMFTKTVGILRTGLTEGSFGLVDMKL